MKRLALLGAMLAVTGALGVSATSALAQTDISITLCAPNCGSAYPLHLNWLDTTVRPKLETASGELLSGEGYHVLYLFGELSMGGTFHTILLRTRKGTEACFNQGEEANGEVATEGSFHVVYTSLAGSTQGLQLGILYLIQELIGASEISCPTNGNKVKVRGSMIAALNLSGSTENTQFTALLDVLNGTNGKQEFRAYYNEVGKGTLAKLESSVDSTGFKETDYGVGVTEEPTALQGKMWVVIHR